MDPHHASTLLRRWFTAACLAATAAAHIAIAPEHLREAPYAGVLFIALATAALASAVLLLSTRAEHAWGVVAALCASALAAYVMSRSVGLPSLGDDIGDWVNPLGMLAVLSETAALLVSGQALRSARTYRSVTDTVRLYTVLPASSVDGAG